MTCHVHIMPWLKAKAPSLHFRKMSRPGSSNDGKQSDDPQTSGSKRQNEQGPLPSKVPKFIRSSAADHVTPFLNDVPRPTRCAVCDKLVGFLGEKEEVIDVDMAKHLERAGFKTGLRSRQPVGCAEPRICGKEFFHIVCTEHFGLHQQQKKLWSQKKYPKNGHQDPARGPFNS